MRMARSSDLITREDEVFEPSAWAHAVNIDGAKPHFPRMATKLYFVLEGSGTVALDGVDHTQRLNGSHLAGKRPS
jgi:hypothetical protein